MTARVRDLLHEAADRFLDVALRRGWTTALSYRIGLHGRLAVDERVLTLAHPPASRLRLVFASDFHAGPTTDPRHLATVVSLLTAASADALLLGGDFVSLDETRLESISRALGTIPAPFGRFAVLGNHDYRAHRANSVKDALEHHGIRVLRNENARLEPPFADVWICGLDDVELGTPDAAATFACAAGTRVLLMHGPDGLMSVSEHRFDLALCGHVHGGQIAFPWGSPIIVPGGALDRRYAHGWFRVGKAPCEGHLLVSRGVGNSALPIRLFADPEIHVIELTPRQ